jgi:hypothetical protein
MPVLAGLPEKMVNTPMLESELLASGLPDHNGIGLPLMLGRTALIQGFSVEVVEIIGMALQAVTE